ncbi:hypothetical protein KAF25_003887 [Fusarium avenaceum]|uniref:NB-ARC domain-containing protein n=1 Tax=Fusarium avenaceum TaxID=40199 RepID=A0A9P7GUE3_9HYPO|nr:hypothetical protein KAF25_003887 [Fusarium avenaceum]
MCVTFSLKMSFLAFLSVIGTYLLIEKSISNSQTRSVDDLRGRHPFDLLYDPEAKTQNATDTRVDIIAVHGLGSNVDRTWTWRGVDKTQEPVNWLKDADMLQSKIPNARILAFNYESTWLSDAPRTRVELCGEDLIHSLHRLRPESNRPIVFIGHSFGGLVIQDALLYADREKKYHHILQHTKGFISLGTPFRGTKFHRVADLIARAMHLFGSHYYILSPLTYDDHHLRDKVHSLGRVRKVFSFPVFCFFELYQTQFVNIPILSNLLQGMVVEESSACLAGDERSHLQTNHLNLNKYPGPGDRSFISVSHQVVRMCEDAMRQTREKDLDPTSSIHKGHWVVPFDRNEGFVGRDSILPDLLVRIFPDHQKDGCQRTVVEGLGGIGKSQIALEAAFRLRDSDPTCSIFWVSALNTISFENAYRDIAQELGVQHANNERSSVVSLVKQALSKQEMGKWLLIVDNTDDPSLMFEPGSLASYLPSSPKGSILFTTRTSEITSLLDIPSVGIFRIDAMSPQESMDLMSTRLSTSQMEDTESLHALLEELFYLPLAIKQAAAYMQQTRETPGKYLGLCQASDKNLIRLLSHGFEDRTRYKDAENPVAKTWLISFKNIPLSILSVLPPQDDLESNRAIGVLRAYGFVTAREDKEFVDMHRLVRLAVRNWLEDRGKDKESYAYVQIHMLVFCDAANYGNQAEWARNMPHCHTVVDEDSLSTSSQVACDLLLVFSKSLLWRGMRKVALDLSRRAKSLSMAIYTPNDLHQIDSMSNYAVSLMMLGHRDEAEEILQETLPQQERAFGKHHHKTLESRRNLASLLLMRGQYKEAEKMYRLEQFQEAEELARQALNIVEAMLGKEHPKTLSTTGSLASILCQSGQLLLAEELSRKLVKAQERILGKEDPETLRSANTLAATLCGLERFLEAEDILRDGLQAYQRLYGEEYDETILSAIDLGSCLRLAGKHREAAEVLHQTIEISRRVFGESHTYTVRCLEQLTLLIPFEF